MFALKFGRTRRHLAALLSAALFASLLAVGFAVTVAPAPAAQAAEATDYLRRGSTTEPQNLTLGNYDGTQSPFGWSAAADYDSGTPWTNSMGKVTYENLARYHFEDNRVLRFSFLDRNPGGTAVRNVDTDAGDVAADTDGVVTDSVFTLSDIDQQKAVFDFFVYDDNGNAVTDPALVDIQLDDSEAVAGTDATMTVTPSPDRPGAIRVTVTATGTVVNNRGEINTSADVIVQLVNGILGRVNTHMVSQSWEDYIAIDWRRSVTTTYDFGDAPSSYATLASDGGPRHSVVSFDPVASTSPLMLGASVDGEADGAPTEDASGDGADEDGVVRPSFLFNGDPVPVTVTVTNNLATEATLAGWVDLNGNDTFDSAERLVKTVPANSGTQTYTLEFPRGEIGTSYISRFRLFSGAVADPAPVGVVSGGEVEDYPRIGVREKEPATLVVEKSSNRTVDSRVGDTITYTVKASNVGDVDFTAAVPATVFDDLTGVLDDATFDGVVTVSPSDADNAGTVTYAEPRIRWQGPLGSGESVTLTYSVVLTGAGDRVVENVAFGGPCPVGEECNPPTPPIDSCVGGGRDPRTGLPCDAVSYGVPALKVDKKADTTVVSADGQSVMYTVTATNSGTSAYTADRPAVVVDDLSGVLDDATLDESSVAASVGGAPTFERPRIRWSGPLGVNESVEITYTVTFDAQASGGNGELVNVAFGPPCSAEDPRCEMSPPPTPVCDPANEQGRDPDTGVPCARVEIPTRLLEVTKTSDPVDGSTVRAGETIVYTITFTNSGSAAAEVKGWTDYLAGVLDDATVTAQPSSASLTVSAIENEKFTVDGTVPPRGEATVSYAVTVKADGERGDDVINNVVRPPGIEPPVRCAADDELCTTHRVPGVVASKSVSPASGTAVAAGDTLTYTLTFTNDGAAAGKVDEIDYLSELLDDARVTSQPTVSDPANPMNPSLTVSDIADEKFTIKGTLQPSQTVTVTYQVMVLSDEQRGDNRISNFLLRPTTDPPPGPECAADDPRCTTNGVPEVVDSKSSSPAPGSTVVAGDVITYTLTFTNEGGAPGNVDKVDDLSHVADDADITSDPSSSDDALAVTPVQDNRFRVTGTLQAGQTVKVTYQVTVHADADRGDNKLANYLLNPDGNPPPEPVCEEGSEDCTVHLAALIVDSKSANPASGSTVRIGQVVTYTLTFENRGAAAGKIDQVDDLTHVLDDGALVSEPTASSRTVKVTAVSDDRYHITGTLGAGDTATVTYQVRVTGAGDQVLANYLLDPDRQPPVDPVCEPDRANNIDCTRHPVPRVVIAKSSDPVTGSAVDAGDTVTYTLTVRNTGTAEGTVDFTDHLAQVLDDAKLVTQPVSDTPSVTAVVEDDSIVLTGSLTAGATARVTYTFEVLERQNQGDHKLGNFVTTTGDQPPTVCEKDSELCTTHPVPPELALTGGTIAIGLLTAAILLIVSGSTLTTTRRRRTNQ